MSTHVLLTAITTYTGVSSTTITISTSVPVVGAAVLISIMTALSIWQTSFAFPNTGSTKIADQHALLTDCQINNVSNRKGCLIKQPFFPSGCFNGDAASFLLFDRRRRITRHLSGYCWRRTSGSRDVFWHRPHWHFVIWPRQPVGWGFHPRVN